MTLARSFRGRLALRFTAVVMAFSVVGSSIGYLVLRRILYDRLDAILLRLAGIEAAATADSPDETVHFHDEIFQGRSSSHETILSRYAEVWTLEGEPVVRTENLGMRNLPLPAAVRERVAASGESELFDLTWEDQHYRAVLYPLPTIGPQHRVHLLQVAASARETETVLFRVVVFLAGIVLAGSVSGGVIGWWMAGYAVRPVLEIIHQAEALEADRRGHHIAAHADTDELRRLVSVLNAMLARIDIMVDGQRQFLADAGHAIKTPLTVLRGDIDVALRRRRSPDDYVQVLQQGLEDLKDVSLLAEDLITLARSDSGAQVPERATIALAPLLHRVAKKYERSAQADGLQLDIQATDGLTVAGDVALLDRAISNLVDNAIKYGRQGRRIVVAAEPVASGWAAIRVSDSGPGMSHEDRVRVFDRFYRGEDGRRTSRGAGLGLAITKAIVESLGGRVEMETAPGRGTTVTLVCPRPPSAEPV